MVPREPVTPVCGSCRRALRPGARFCRNCGAQASAVCESCSTPISVSQRFCTGCAAPIGATASGQAPKAATAPPAAPPATPSRRGGARTAMILTGAIAIGGIMIAAAVALRGSPPAPTPTPVTDPEDVVLVAKSYPDLGFAISHPRGWVFRRETVGPGRIAVIWRDPSGGRQGAERRAFSVIAEPSLAFDEARRTTEASTQQDVPGYHKVEIVDGLMIGDRRAFRHSFRNESLRFDQWWMDGGGGSFRLTIWSPEDRYNEAQGVNERIALTFQGL